MCVILSIDPENRIISSRVTVANAAIAILSELLVHAVTTNQHDTKQQSPRITRVYSVSVRGGELWYRPIEAR